MKGKAVPGAGRSVCAHRSGRRARPCDLCVGVWRAFRPRASIAMLPTLLFVVHVHAERVGSERSGVQERGRGRSSGDRGRYHRHTTAKQRSTAAGRTRPAVLAKEEQRSPLARKRATRCPAKTYQLSPLARKRQQGCLLSTARSSPLACKKCNVQGQLLGARMKRKQL